MSQPHLGNASPMRRQMRGPDTRQLDTNGSSSSTKAAARGYGAHEPEFKYRELLLLSLAVPFGIMLAFGGKPSLLMLCFGALISYIFDLLGSIEGTLMAVLISGLGLWATMVLSARMMLSESILNFPLIVVMGLSLIAIFIIICAHFKSLLIEFENSFYFGEVVLFATTPLLSSVVISWFLCVEIPTLNLSFCFSTCYLLNTLWLLAPRPSSHPSSVTANSFEKTNVFAVPRKVVAAVYTIPLILSPVLHIALTHHVALDSWKRLGGLSVSFLYPLLCMLVCAEQQIDYWQDDNVQAILKTISNTKLGASAVLFFFLQNHPVLDDLKSLSHMPESQASAVLCGAALLGTITLYLHRYIQIKCSQELHSMKLDDTSDKLVSSLLGPYLLSSLTAGLCGLLVIVFFGMARNSSLLGFFGAIFASDFYRFSKNYKWDSLRSIVGTFMAILFTVITVRVLLLDFLFKTIIYMTFTLDWAPSPMTMTGYCGRICDVFTLAVAAPTLAMGLNDHLSDQKGPLKGLILPVGVPASSSVSPWILRLNSVKASAFSFLLILFTVQLTTAELIIREQNWTSVGVGSETVYPAYLFIGIAFVSTVTVWHLHMINKLSVSLAWIVTTLQLSKLFSLVGVSSLGIAVTSIAVLAYTLPFVLSCTTTTMGDKRIDARREKEKTSDSSSESDVKELNGSTDVKDAVSFSAPTLLVLIYLAVALFVTNMVHVHLVHDVLENMMLRDPSEEQKVAACVSLWCLFAALVSLAFFKAAALPRSLLLLVSATSALVAFKALPFSFEVDPNSPTYLVLALHPELADAHEAVFLLFCAMLLVAAGMNFVPMKQTLPRLLFLLTFSYCAARTLLGFEFPLALNADSPQHGTFQLPWLYCFFSAFTATSSAIHSYVNSKPKASKEESSFGIGMFVASSCLPSGATLLSLIAGTYEINCRGIFWTAAICSALVTVFRRVSEIMKEVKSRGTAGGDRKVTAALATVASSAALCLITASTSIFYTVSASLISHSVSSDLTVPLSCLTLLCVNRGISNAHPALLAGAAASAWWVVSSLYTILLKGYFTGSDLSHFELNVGIFGEENVSYWNTGGLFYPTLNFSLMLLPLPAIVLGYLRRKNESEDILFVLALMSLVSLVGAQCSSVRLLGVMGTVFGAWRFYDVGARQADSNRLI